MYTCIYIYIEDDDDDDVDDDDDDIRCMGRGQNPLTPGMFISSKYDIIGNLVGGIPTPLKNMSSSVGIIVPN